MREITAVSNSTTIASVSVFVSGVVRLRPRGKHAHNHGFVCHGARQLARRHRHKQHAFAFALTVPNIPIIWVRGSSAGVADICKPDAFDFVEGGVRRPEST